MTERPILFSGPMVRALLDGTKTQTRRVITDQPMKRPGGKYEPHDPFVHGDGLTWGWMCGGVTYIDNDVRCRYGRPGDRLRVLETWAVGKCADGFKPLELDPPTWLGDNGGLWYAADDAKPKHPISERGKWRPGRFMPKAGHFWPSRITLEITDVRVERVRQITAQDALAEGIERPGLGVVPTGQRCVERFATLWDSINAPRGFSWESNPWVWALSFHRVPDHA